MTTRTLTFTPDDASDTTIFRAGDVVYRVATRSSRSGGTATVVSDGRGAVVGTLEWGTVSDRVVLPGQRPVPFAEWVQKSAVSFNEAAFFKDERGRRYKWKGVGERCVELFCEDDQYRSAVARYTRAHAGSANDRSGNSQSRTKVRHSPGELRLTSRAKEVQDLVVLSLIFLENQAQRKASGMHVNDPLVAGLMQAALRVM